MIAAHTPVQRPADARLLVIDARGRISHQPRSAFSRLARAGDVVIANDAATLPASLFGVHVATGLPIEVRLAGRRSLDTECIKDFSAVVFGSGDFRIPTEHRPPPPILRASDLLQLGPLRATVTALLGHPRLIALHFEDSVDNIWEGIARHGRPIQYAHIPAPLAIWDTWTPLAGLPVAFEPPSAGFMVDWAVIQSLRRRGVQFAAITHAAGISSTGDPELDARLPLDEPYRIPPSAARAIMGCRAQGGRVIAVGTTVVRALEHAARIDGVVRPGVGLANQRIGAGTRLRIVDALISGTHERGTSHHELLRAFAGTDVLQRMDKALEAERYRTHEYGDSIFIETRSLRAGRDVDCASCEAGWDAHATSCGTGGYADRAGCEQERELPTKAPCVSAMPLQSEAFGPCESFASTRERFVSARESFTPAHKHFRWISSAHSGTSSSTSTAIWATSCANMARGSTPSSSASSSARPGSS